MAFRFVRRKAEKAYEALIECVRSALEEGDSEFAVICGAPLVKMGEVEGGNYVRYPYVNEAMELGQRVVELAEREGVPSWLRRHVEEIKKVLRESGYI